MRYRSILITLIAILVLILAGCAAPPAPQAAAPSSPAEGETAPAIEYKMAAIFPGPITDADYNTLGYNGLKAVETELGVEVAYSESVAVPDVDRVMREYIDAGFNIIFTHGGQFLNQSKELAAEFPAVRFIGEFDGPVADAPANLWVIDRNFHIGFYAIGALAALQTQSGKIGYIGGLTLPFSYAEVHAMQQAIADAGADVSLQAVWVGDFNDPSKARELTDAMTADGVDVIVGSLNLGMFGVFEAAKAAPEQVWVTAKYTDKSSFAEKNYVTSVLYDFEGPLKKIVGKIQAGEGGGYYPLGFATGVNLQFPLQNSSPEVESAIQDVIARLQSGAIEVVKNTEAIQ